MACRHSRDVAAHEQHAQHSIQSALLTPAARIQQLHRSLSHLIAAKRHPTAAATSAVAGGPPAADRNPGQIPRHMCCPGLVVLKEAGEARGAACRVVQDAEGECSWPVSSVP